jgi:hypothetical protein
MTDFLTRMARRALEPVTEIRPDLAPTFAHVTAAPREDAGLPPELGTHRAEQTGEPAADSARSISERVSASPSNASVDDGRVRSRSADDRDVAAPTAIRPIEAAIRPSFWAQGDAPTSAAPRVSLDSENIDRAPRAEVAPRLDRDRHSESARDGARAAEPAIRVTIGRIDVRAITAPAQASAPARMAAAPRRLRTLDDYLRARNGERP